MLRDAGEQANTRREQRTHAQSVEQEITALRLALREARDEASKATEGKVEALAKERSASEVVDNVHVMYEQMETENKMLQSEIASQRHAGILATTRAARTRNLGAISTARARPALSASGFCSATATPE